MPKNLSYALFFTTLITGIIMAISSNTWMGAWMGLEINLLSFIPLVNYKNSVESSIKYFLVQALASSLLMMSTILLSLWYTLNNIFMDSSLIFILNSSLFLKMGAAPFHFWFPGVMEGLPWLYAFLLMTIQKIAPLILMMSCLNFKFLKWIIVLSLFIGGLGGFTQTSLRKLMAYSSINHLGWLLSTYLIAPMYWLIYFFFYTLLTLIIVSLCNLMKAFYLNQLYSNLTSNFMLKFTFMCSLLSLGGLPPFTGFAPKWMVIQSLSFDYPPILLSMVMSTLITLFFYIRISYSAFLITYTTPSWNLNNQFQYNFLINTILGVSLLGLPVILMI